MAALLGLPPPPPSPPAPGSGRALKNPVHVDDLMRGFLSVVGNPVAYGKTYNFSGGEDITIWDLAHLMLRHQGIAKRFVPLPVWLCTAAAGVLEGRMARSPITWNAIAGITQDANLDNSEARRDLGYAPIGIREGLQRCSPISQALGTSAPAVAAT